MRWPIGMRRMDIEYISSRLFDYPHLAQAPISVKPPLVPGDHVSVRLREGWRVWAFATAAERDKFIIQFGGLAFPEE